MQQKKGWVLFPEIRAVIITLACFSAVFSGQAQAIALLLRIFIYVKPVVPGSRKSPLRGFRLFWAVIETAFFRCNHMKIAVFTALSGPTRDRNENSLEFL